MDRAFIILVVSTALFASIVEFSKVNGEETILSAVLTPNDQAGSVRQERSYYERYGTGRYDDDRPSKCGRCVEDRYDDRDDDRTRDKYDDDRRPNRPTYGSRHDRNKNYDSNEDDKRYSTDGNNNQKNGTEDENDNDKKKEYDDKDRHRGRPSSGRRDRDRDRNRHDDRDRYSPDYYDRFLRDPYRERYDRPYYEDSYRERRPYHRYDDGYGGRYDGYGYPAYRRPAYEDRYDRGTGYDDYGGYGTGAGRGPHDSFRPWDETYRGTAGWDAGGRGYYFASGRPDAGAGAASAWSRPEYSRPEATSGSWQNVGYNTGYGGGGGYGSGYSSGYGNGYSTGYREPADYRGSVGYSDGGYRQDFSAGYGQASGWRDVGGRRPYRDQREPVGYTGYQEPAAGQASGWRDVGERRPYRDQSGLSQVDKGIYGQPASSENRYNQNRQTGYGQPTSIEQHSPNSQGSSSPATSYLHQREDEQVSIAADQTTKAPS